MAEPPKMIDMDFAEVEKRVIGHVLPIIWADLQAACTQLVDHGKVELGTPASKRLVHAYGELSALLGKT